MKRILTQRYFSGRNTEKIAKSLLGKFLIRKYHGKTKAHIITEVEAYDGFKDKASHAHRGRTERNKIMFGFAGHWYVYFTYGMHYMLNIVTGPMDYPAAVLIRGVKDISGPARITKALHIDKNLNGRLANKESELWIEDCGIKILPKNIKKYPRIGVAYAGPVWSKKKYRFCINN